MLSLIGLAFVSTGGIGKWQKGKEASMVLVEVETAQRSFLADHPQRRVSTLTEEEVASYMDGNPGSLPTVEDLDGNTLKVDVTQAPPVWVTSGGKVYDPSGSSDDSLWDAGR